MVEEVSCKLIRDEGVPTWVIPFTRKITPFQGFELY